MFVLTGRGFHPDDVTNRVGLAPSKTWRAGEQRGESLLRWEHDGWCLSTACEETIDLGAQIQDLLSRLLPVADLLVGVMDEFDLDAEIACELSLQDQAPSIVLSPELLKNVLAVRAGIDIDLLAIE
jgi:hypothetical protein